MIYKCPRFDERVDDGCGFVAKRAINQSDSRRESSLILFDRSRACNLIVRVTNDPFVPRRLRQAVCVHYVRNTIK